MPVYYRSRYLPDPIVYVQDEGHWSSYAPAGVIRRSRGTIPDGILGQTVEIPQSDAETLIRRRLAEAEKIEVQRAQIVGYPQYRDPGPVGLGGFIIVAIIWLALTIFGGFLLTGISSSYVEGGLVPAMMRAGNLLHSSFWVPLIVFDSLAGAALIIAPIVTLVFIFQRKRMGRMMMIVFCGFCLLVALVDLVAATSFGIETLRHAGYGDAADALLGQQIYGMIGAVLGAAVFLPYFLLSKRVKNTLVNPKPVPAGYYPMGAMIPPGVPGTRAGAQRNVARPYAALTAAQQAPRHAAAAAPAAATASHMTAAQEGGRFCTQCGSYQAGNARFCSGCGVEMPSQS